MATDKTEPNLRGIRKNFTVNRTKRTPKQPPVKIFQGHVLATKLVQFHNCSINNVSYI